MTEGLNESGQGTTKFLSISRGALIERSSSTDPKATKRTKKDGSEVWERRFADLTGKLKAISIKTHPEFGKFLKIELKTTSDVYVVEFNFDSGYSSSFLMSIPNAKLEELVKLSPSFKDDKAKLFIQQKEGWLKNYFTKETPNGLPELVKTTYKGEEVWDNTARLVFFEEMVGKLSAKLQTINAPIEVEVVDPFNNSPAPY